VFRSIKNIQVLIAIGLVLNWAKSSSYLKVVNGSPRLKWLDFLHITWVENDEVNKLLGMVYGLSLTSWNAHESLVGRINKSLGYWSSTKINSTCKGTVVNGVLLSSTCFFIFVWDGTKKGVSKVKGAMTNYFLSSSLNRSR
jgi:hypothetical protein